MMKRLLSVTLVAFASTLCAATITVEPAATTIVTGDTVKLSIDISGVSNLYAWQFELGFIPGVLSPTSIDDGSFLREGGETVFVPSIISGEAFTYLADTLLGAVPGVNGSGLLATVTFRALAAGTSPITISNIILLDSTLADINPGTRDASVIVQGSGAAAPEPATWLLLGPALGLIRFRGRRVAQP